MRRRALEGKAFNTGWAEWAVDFQSDPTNQELWYQCNPSLGTLFTVRSVQDEVGDDEIDFNIQRLGLWIKYNLKSAIAEWEWNELSLKGALPHLPKESYVGIRYGHDGENVAASVALKLDDGRVFVEALDIRPIRAGNAWIIEYLAALKPNKIVIDGANGQDRLSTELKERKIRNVFLPKTKDIVNASSDFEMGITNKTICHNGQPSLTQSVTNCEHRAIGNNGGFGYRSIKQGVDVALLDSIILAHWACVNAKEKKKQTMSY